MSIVKGIALITGSAEGIGRSIALRLARDGFNIALNDLPSKRDQLLAVAEDINDIGRKTLLVPGDVSIDREVKGMVQDVSNELGGLDVMVANAGTAELTPLVSIELEEWEHIMAVNARGPFLCYKYAAQQMIKQGHGGRIIGASSIFGKWAFPSAAAYNASKFAVRGLTQTAAQELGRHNITVNAYAPGPIKTLLASVLGEAAETDPKVHKWLTTRMATRALEYDGQVEDIASIVSYLASKEAHFITGKLPSTAGLSYLDLIEGRTTVFPF